jgi:hypothetical protein
MDVLFIASTTLISNDTPATRELLSKACGLPLASHSADDAYVFSDAIGGSKHFGVWPLTQAAQACFGTSEWPKGRPVPQVSIELELKDERAVSDAESELRAQGYDLLHATRKEPWGQTVCRLLTAEGAILGLSYAPWLHA